MTEEKPDPLVRASLGDVELAEAVRALPRDELEQVAASALALAKHSAKSSVRLGQYARKIVDHSMQTLINTIRPLTDDATDLILNAL